jgi:hypothetical protein
MKQTKNFFITYFAKKHSKFITRKASEPNPKGTAGKEFTDRNGVNRYIYWDLDKGDWRHATGKWNIKAV